MNTTTICPTLETVLKVIPETMQVASTDKGNHESTKRRRTRMHSFRCVTRGIVHRYKAVQKKDGQLGTGTQNVQWFTVLKNLMESNILVLSDLKIENDLLGSGMFGYVVRGMFDTTLVHCRNLSRERRGS